MVLKLTGSLLVTCSCGALGLWKAAQWKEHLKMMEQLKKMVLMLKREILYGHTPLAKLLDRSAEERRGFWESCLGARRRGSAADRENCLP